MDNEIRSRAYLAHKKWMDKNRERELNKKRIKASEYRALISKNPERMADIFAYKKLWRERNRYRLARLQREKRLNNPSYRFLSNMRNLIRMSIKNGYKSGSTEALLGCSIEDFMKHLESKFTKEMSWDMFGKGAGKIHCDHILPCSLFDLSDPDQQRACFNYKNFQPMIGSANEAKSDLLPDGRMARNLSRDEKLKIIADSGLLV